MFHELKSWHLIGWMAGALIMAMFILLQATGNLLIISVAMQLVFYVVVPVCFFGYHFKKRGIRLKGIVFLQGSARWLVPVLALVVLSMAFATSVYWLMLRALMAVAPHLVSMLLQAAPLPEEVWYLVSIALIIGVIGPISEEFVFRGLILTRLIAKFGLWTGIGLSSFLFGIFHIDFFGAFLFAVVASLLYLKTGNLLIPILLHIVNNSIAVYLLIFNPGFPEWLTVTSINDLYTKAVPNLIVLIISLTLLLLVIFRLAHGIKEPKLDSFDLFDDHIDPPIDAPPANSPDNRPGPV